MTVGTMLGFTLFAGFVILLGLVNRNVKTRRRTGAGADGSAVVYGGDSGCDAGDAGCDGGGGDGGGGGD